MRKEWEGETRSARIDQTLATLNSKEAKKQAEKALKGGDKDKARSIMALSARGAGLLLARNTQGAGAGFAGMKQTLSEMAVLADAGFWVRWLTVDCVVPRQPPFLPTPLK
ncbi:hypothetical protein [Mesorhizobium ventifaucium]|uniref:Uncharacterized protein n=1 Tax=Mesorhizobium ventifaucium TaxID=666020 RepID=A0ABN8JI23_9HYPH|nr:hypothetical protein [Mesorhizobium ventifaucium]CAH2397530.1 hypothetical protein MES4922_190265 [Mesorhizobium ventifaucium]